VADVPTEALVPEQAADGPSSSLVQERVANGPCRARVQVECPAQWKKKVTLQASMGLEGVDGKLTYMRFRVSFLFFFFFFSCEVYLSLTHAFL